MARSNLAVRVATAVVAVPLLLALLLWGGPWSFFALTFAVCIAGSSEIFQMTHPSDKVAQWLGILTSLAVHVGIYLGSGEPRVLLTLLFTLPVLGLLLPLWRVGEIQDAGSRQMAGIAGPLYIGGLLASLAILRRDAGHDGAAYVILVLTMAWFGDTAGYFVGKSLGRHKLAPKVSPNKTWEGFGGALLGGVLAAVGGSLSYLPSLPLGAAVGLGLVAGAVGQLGDLAESLLKRSSGVKDSGTLIPGHGGLLDRVDAVLFIAPMVHLFWAWRGLVGG